MEQTHWLAVTLERVPIELTGDDWTNWCTNRGWHPLTDPHKGRGAWIPQLKTYLRGASHLVYFDGEFITLATDEDLADPSRLRASEAGQVRKNPMNEAEPLYQAQIETTLEQIEQVKLLLGENRVAHLVMGDNGVAAFWSEGPAILQKCRKALNLPDGDHRNDWEALTPSQKDLLVAIAAGNTDWAAEAELDYQYVREWFDNYPEAYPLLHQRPRPPEEPA